ncbi:hypothetical protein ES705_11001 [subsurface metagenome]
MSEQITAGINTGRMHMMHIKIDVVNVEINQITLKLHLHKIKAAKILRANKPTGTYKEIGVAFATIYKDSFNVIQGQTYYYYAVPWVGPYHSYEKLITDQEWIVPATVPKVPKERTIIITKKHEEFTIVMGGYLDESNTVTKGPETYCPGPNNSMPPYDQFFEPNMYVVIENVGNVDVLNPWIVVGKKRDWWSIDTIVKEILPFGEPTEREKLLSLWRFLVDEVYDSRCGLSWFDGMADPVKLLNVYGFDGCVANAIAGRRLAESLGFQAREIWLGGILDGYGRGRECLHAVLEVRVDGEWHLLDTDQMVFFLKHDNNTIASAEDLASDIDLLRRSHRNLGLCGRDMKEKTYYDTYFLERNFLSPPSKDGIWMDNSGFFNHLPGKYPDPHTMSLRLRPGEKLIRYWSNIGKSVVRGTRLHKNVRFSNGKFLYKPDLHDSTSINGIYQMYKIVHNKNRNHVAIHPEKPGETSEVIWEIASPYAIAGALVQLSFQANVPVDGLEMLFSKDGHNWRSIWVATGNAMSESINLDLYVNPALNDWNEEKDRKWRIAPLYKYSIKIAMWAGSDVSSVGLNSIVFDTDIQCATRSLPSLFSGSNRVSYRDDTICPHKVRLTYGWRENHTVRPPSKPIPIFPADGIHIDCLDFDFRWRQPNRKKDQVDDYHIQVSRYSDFRWCVCPTFDRYNSRTKFTGQTRWRPQFSNLLNPDERYYWRVRAKNISGVWGRWSKTFSFIPHGPRHPIDLQIRKYKDNTYLTWSPNQNGNRPMKYHVYGLTEQGFSVSDDCYLDSVKETQWLMGKEMVTSGMAFRIVAVDEKGVSSVPSDYLYPNPSIPRNSKAQRNLKLDKTS